MKFDSAKRARLLARLNELVAKGHTATECARDVGVTDNWVYKNLPSGAFKGSHRKQEIAKRNASLRDWVLEGNSTKAWAMDRGLSHESISKIMCAVGLRKYFLTKEEYATVMAARKQRKAA